MHLITSTTAKTTKWAPDLRSNKIVWYDFKCAGKINYFFQCSLCERRKMSGRWRQMERRRKRGKGPNVNEQLSVNKNEKINKLMKKTQKRTEGEAEEDENEKKKKSHQIFKLILSLVNSHSAHCCHRTHNAARCIHSGYCPFQCFHITSEWDSQDFHSCCLTFSPLIFQPATHYTYTLDYTPHTRTHF